MLDWLVKLLILRSDIKVVPMDWRGVRIVPL